MRRKNAIWICKVLFILLAFSMNYTTVGYETAEENFEKIFSGIPHIAALLISVDAQPLRTLLLLLLLMKFFRISDVDKQSGRKKFVAEVLAWTASICIFVGNALYQYDGLTAMFCGTIQLTKSLIIVAGYYLFFERLFLVLISRYENCLEDGKSGFCSAFFGGRFAGTIVFLLLLLVWGGVLFVYYPAIFMGDTEDIIYMAFNYPTGLINTVILPREGVYLTNHHPVAYTAFVRFVMELIGGGYKCSDIYMRGCAVHC